LQAKQKLKNQRSLKVWTLNLIVHKGIFLSNFSLVILIRPRGANKSLVLGQFNPRFLICFKNNLLFTIILILFRPNVYQDFIFNFAKIKNQYFWVIFELFSSRTDFWGSLKSNHQMGSILSFYCRIFCYIKYRWC